MTVYVDTMKAKFKGMTMCHMIADSMEELHEMAAKIGLKREWFQGDHYDISLSKKNIALKNGAVLVTWEQLSCMCSRLKYTGECGAPEDAKRWFLEEGRALKKAMLEKINKEMEVLVENAVCEKCHGKMQQLRKNSIIGECVDCGHKTKMLTKEKLGLKF